MDITPLEVMIEERRVATCLPIRAEVLSGQMSSDTRSTITEAFKGMIAVDPDWRSPQTWDQVILLAERARTHRLPIPGLVDRMIIVAAELSGTQIWSLDKPLKKLATTLDIPTL